MSNKFLKIYYEETNYYFLLFNKTFFVKVVIRIGSCLKISPSICISQFAIDDVVSVSRSSKYILKNRKKF